MTHETRRTSYWVVYQPDSQPILKVFHNGRLGRVFDWYSEAHAAATELKTAQPTASWGIARIDVSHYENATELIQVPTPDSSMEQP